MVPFDWPARNRRNAYEKSAKENRLAIAMNVTSGRGMPRNVTRRGCFGAGARAGSRTNNTMRTERAAGIAASRRMPRYRSARFREANTVPSRTNVTTGPAIAPAVSMLRWNPKAFPRVSAWVDSISSASRGASRTPFPVRSTTRIPMNSGQLVAKGKRAFITVERA